ncbi:hypothetical protein ACWZEH_30515 [Streptomyces sp. QTS137]
MKIASHALLAVSLISMTVANGVLLTSDTGTARRRFARKGVIIIVPFIVLGITGMLLT